MPDRGDPEPLKLIADALEQVLFALMTHSRHAHEHHSALAMRLIEDIREIAR